MKFISSKSGYAHTTYIVEPENTMEKAELSNHVLITMVDNGMRSITKEEADIIDNSRLGENGVCHFGGTVKKASPYFTIKVYTD